MHHVVSAESWLISCGQRCHQPAELCQFSQSTSTSDKLVPHWGSSVNGRALDTISIIALSISTGSVAAVSQHRGDGRELEPAEDLELAEGH